MAFFLPVLCLLILSLIGMVLYTRGTFRFVYLVQKIPGPSLWELVTVHAKRFWTDTLTHLCEQCEHYAYEPWAMWTMLGDYVVVISSLESVSAMYQSKNLTTKPDLYSSVEYYVGEGSFSLRDSEKWRLHRKAITPAFHKAVLDSNIDVISDGAENILKKLREIADGPSFDITKIIDQEVTKCTIRFLFSGKTVVPDPDIPRYVRAIARGMTSAQSKMTNPVQYWLQQRFHKPSREIESYLRTVIKGFKTGINTANDEITAEIKNRVDKEPRSVVECILTYASKPGIGLGNEEIVDECLTVSLAGLDTTKSAVKSTILLLALHQEVQQRVFHELDDIFGSSDQPPTLRDLDRMEYLGMVIKEALRLFPPGPIIMKKAVEETNLNGTIIPRGTIVVANIMALHRNPHNFEDPMEFIPERFLPELSEKRHPHSYIPFSFGMRNCPGKALAFMMLKLFLSSILRQYKILPGEGTNSMDDIKLEFHVTLDITECAVKIVSRK